MKKFIFSISLFLVSLANAMEFDPNQIDPRDVNFAQIKSQILIPYRCTRCHLGIGSESKFSRWINVEKPEESIVWIKVSTGQMPKIGRPVSLQKQALLLQYLKDFASTH